MATPAHSAVNQAVTPAWQSMGQHFSTPRAPYPGIPQPVELSLISLFPAIAQPGELSFITIRVTNNTDFPLADLTANLGIASTRFVARSGVHDWLDAEINGTLNLINEQPIPEIFPGNSIELGFQINPEQVPGLNDQRGPRAMALYITDVAGDVLAQVNSYYLWDPGSSANPVSISFIAPITGVMPPADPENFTAELPILIAKEERFLAVIEAAQAAVAASGNPSAFTLAVDQALASVAAALSTGRG
ncbi:MAG: hypothetical protein FWG25_09800, partial [Promicromonosporaceae bacterium]|nr:hypothetical protein [Promicromonosporaceae bacterium]